MKSNVGFSLIELLISIAILATLAIGVSLWLGNYKRSVDLDSSSKIIVSLLRSAQAKASSGKDSKNWGVSFDEANNKIVLFSDDGTAKTTSEEDYFPESVKINGDSLSGGCDEIVFLGPKGETVRDCAIRIEDAINSSIYKDISVKTTGYAGVNP